MNWEELKSVRDLSTTIEENQHNALISNQHFDVKKWMKKRTVTDFENKKQIYKITVADIAQLTSIIKGTKDQINSLSDVYKAIKNGNQDLKKEIKLRTETICELKQHIKDNEKKYNDEYLESMSVYNSIPCIKHLNDLTNQEQKLLSEIEQLQNRNQSLDADFKLKKEKCWEQDKVTLIKLAEFFVREIPLRNKIKAEKLQSIRKLKDEIDLIKNKKNCHIDQPESITMDDRDNHVLDFSNLTSPKIKANLEIISNKLNMIRGKDIEGASTKKDFELQHAETNKIKHMFELENDLQSNSNYESITIIENMMKELEEKKLRECNRVKLINVLEDIKLIGDDIKKVMANVDLGQLKRVQTIQRIAAPLNTGKDHVVNEESECEPMNIDINNELLIPPTQFKDNSSQQANDNVKYMSNTELQLKEVDKKKVTFNLTPIKESTNDGVNINATLNDSANSQLNTSTTSQESYSKIKDMILKKHNLDVSPQFIYPQKTAMKQDKNVKSKFFNEEHQSESMQVDAATEVEEGTTQNLQNENDNIGDKNRIVSSIIGERATNDEASGFIFDAGGITSMGIMDSFDASLMTTGDECELDYPQCIDTNLLLSPKADMPNSITEPTPGRNFLTGTASKKEGISFFGKNLQAKQTLEDSSQNADNNFTFNFGNNDKKNRNGFFSMFH